MALKEPNPTSGRLFAAAACAAVITGLWLDSGGNEIDCYGTRAEQVVGGVALSVRVSLNDHIPDGLLVETNGQSAPFNGELFIPDTALTADQLNSGKIRPGIVESGTSGILAPCPPAPFRT